MRFRTVGFKEKETNVLYENDPLSVGSCCCYIQLGGDETGKGGPPARSESVNSELLLGKFKRFGIVE